MKAFLKSLTLENFKGVKKQTYNFSDKTKIFGRNASGKTRQRTTQSRMYGKKSLPLCTGTTESLLIFPRKDLKRH